MQLDVLHRDGIVILQPHGRVTCGHADSTLRDALHEALGGREPNLIIDLGDVTLIDSSGLGELMTAFGTARRRGGAMKLIHLPPKVQDVLQIARLLTMFEVFEDEDEAIASFR
jgi:anti-sigma B factor antagonist